MESAIISLPAVQSILAGVELPSLFLPNVRIQAVQAGVESPILSLPDVQAVLTGVESPSLSLPTVCTVCSNWS